MELWDQGFVDEEVEGYFEFGTHGRGSFQFGYVGGGIDCEDADRGGGPAVEFSWSGHDEMEPSAGRGWAALSGEGIKGEISFHGGDRSRFRATKAKPRRTRGKARGGRP